MIGVEEWEGGDSGSGNLNLGRRRGAEERLIGV